MYDAAMGFFLNIFWVRTYEAFYDTQVSRPNIYEPKSVIFEFTVKKKKPSYN